MSLSSHTVRARRLIMSGVAACVVLLGGAGCEDENLLSGSLTDFYDVDFDTVRARLYPSELAIEYARNNGEVPVRVTLEVAEGQAPGAGSFNLPERGDVTGRSGTNDIPPLESGVIEIESITPTDGGAIVGTFDASFRTGDDTTSLNGIFDTALEVVEDTDGYVIDGFPKGQNCDDPVILESGGLFVSTLDGNDSDAVGGSGCGAEGNDNIISFVLEEAREVEFTPDFDGDINATLQVGSCGFGDQVACFSGTVTQTIPLEPGEYFVLIEGEGNFRFGASW